MKTLKELVETYGSYCDSTMRWLSGEEVVAHLFWDDDAYYLWFEASDGFSEWCEEIDREDMLIGLENELAQIGRVICYDLDSVNEYCKRYCGSDDPFDRAEFYEDDWGNICGA